MYISGPVTGDDFVNRKKMLAELVDHAQRQQFCCLIGLRRTGKTSLMIKTMESLANWECSYFNVQTAISVPERFATAYVGSLLFWVLWRTGQVGDADLPHFFDLNYAQQQALSLAKPVARFLLELDNTVDRREVNYNQVLQQAFAFPQVLADVLEKPIAVFIDEFQDIVQLDAYGVDTLKLFRSVTQMQSGAWYCLGGSSISQLNTLVNAEESPLFGQYKTYLVGAFEYDGLQELVKRVTGQPVSEAVCRAIQRFSGGYPFYVSVLAGATHLAARRMGLSEANEESVVEGIVDEVCTPGGSISIHCRQVFETMLRVATQSTVSRGIMLYLSNNERSRAAEVARYIGRSPDYIRQILVRLVETDLLQVDNKKRYSISDPVLAFWLRKSYFEIEVNPLAQIDFAATRERMLDEVRAEVLSQD